MELSKKLKELRKQKGMSQEQLAEKLNVSRQTITKWETGLGIPDIENMKNIAILFHVSLDELLLGKSQIKHQEFLYESQTEYDIDYMKRCDMKLGSAYQIHVTGYQGEKIKITLASSQIETLDSDLKIKIDVIKNIIDIQINKRNQITESELKESLFIFVQIPENYIQNIEINAYSQQLMINSLECQNLEFNGKLSYSSIQDFKGTIEYDHNMDMLIECKSIDGAIEINQISATAKLIIPQDLSFHIIKKGIGNHIYYKDESINNELSDCIIELNGMKSELIIEKV